MECMPYCVKDSSCVGRELGDGIYVCTQGLMQLCRQTPLFKHLKTVKASPQVCLALKCHSN